MQFIELRRTLARWRNEHALVADEATATNLRRLRLLAPLAAACNGVAVLVFLVQSLRGTLSRPLVEWSTTLMMAHLGAGVLMVICAVAANALRHAHRSLAARLLTLFVVAGTLLFSIVMVAVDQVAAPNISPFLITSVLCSLMVYTRPTSAAVLYATAAVAFGASIGWMQPEGTPLLQDRLNGMAVCMLGWALSFLLWRKFTTTQLLQEQLDKANAELLHKQKELERLTRHDGLTGLYNRNTFVELTRRELQRARRQACHTSIMLIDLDHFKRVNDTWGHPAGDAVLRHVAALVNRSIRSTDLAGRLGGEEFILLLPGTSVESARKIAEKIRARLEITPAQWEQVRIPVTASIGLAGTSASESRDFEHLYTEADKALYLAKHRGRNQVI